MQKGWIVKIAKTAENQTRKHFGDNWGIVIGHAAGWGEQLCHVYFPTWKKDFNIHQRYLEVISYGNQEGK